MEPFLGEIRPFAGTFAPRGWALCNGQLMAISSNTALFSLLGTTYGGDGRSTFALPDLQNRAGMGMGNGPGLTPRVEGEQDGESTVTLTADQMPVHTHQFQASGDDANVASPVNATGALTPSPTYRTDTDTTMAAAALAPTGSNAPHNNLQPYLALTYIIAVQGIYPSRP